MGSSVHELRLNCCRIFSGQITRTETKSYESDALPVVPAGPILVRAWGNQNVGSSAQWSGRISFDRFEVDLRSGEVWENGTRVRLQEQPFQVLRVLLERNGEIVTREELKRTLWASDTFVDFDDGLNTAVKKIRDLLDDSAEQPRYIETIPRRGYRFMCAVERPLPAEADAASAPSPGLVVSPPVPEPPVERKSFRRAASVAAGVLVLILVLVGTEVRLSLIHI